MTRKELKEIILQELRKVQENNVTGAGEVFNSPKLIKPKKVKK